MLRADPPIVDRSGNMMGRDPDQFERSSPFPVSTFNFSYPPYDNFLDPTGSVAAIGRGEFGPLHGSDENQSADGHYLSSASSSVPRSSFHGPQNTKNGLSAAAAEVSAVMAESYAQLDATNLAGMDDSRLDYRLMNFYSSHNVAQHPFTHVDPAQTFSIEQDTGAYPSFQPSPSSDGWGNGASATTSPEPNTSNASTPPSGEGAPSGQNARPTAAIPHKVNTTSKFIPMKQGGQEVKKKTLSVRIGGEVRSGASTPDPPNCQTTNTPLWRRDPEGHPLCTSFRPPGSAFRN
jgi:GATA-binding protein